MRKTKYFNKDLLKLRTLSTAALTLLFILICMVLFICFNNQSNYIYKINRGLIYLYTIINATVQFIWIKLFNKNEMSCKSTFVISRLTIYKSKITDYTIYSCIYAVLVTAINNTSKYLMDINISLINIVLTLLVSFLTGLLINLLFELIDLLLIGESLSSLLYLTITIFYCIYILIFFVDIISIGSLISQLTLTATLTLISILTILVLKAKSISTDIKN